MSVFFTGVLCYARLGMPDGTPTGGVFGFAEYSHRVIKNSTGLRGGGRISRKPPLANEKKSTPEYKAGAQASAEDFLHKYRCYTSC